MKDFLIKILFFLLPVLILGIGTELLLRSIPNEYSIKKEYLDKNASDIKILILGSSHAYRGINPDFFSEPAFNAAMFSQSLDYDLKILEKYQDELVNLKSLIVPISYFTLFTNLEMGIESWRIKNYNIYYDLHNERNWTSSTEILNTPLKKNISRIKDFYLYGEDHVEMEPHGWEGYDKSATSTELQETGIEASARHTFKTHQDISENIENLNEIIKIASVNDWKVLLIIPPGFESYTENLAPEQLSLTIEHSMIFSNRHSHVEFLNLLKSNDFNKNDFYDADHLNIEGAQKLSVLIDQFISN